MTEPDEGPQYVAPPAPDPPTEGWWLDPKDPTLIRYHDGTQWTRKLGRSTAPRAGAPAHQGAFLLGAGRRGFPTGEPLAPATGRYLSGPAIAGLVAAFTAGVALWVLFPPVGAPLTLAALAGMIVPAWSAGYRPSLPWRSFGGNAFFGYLAVGSLGNYLVVALFGDDRASATFDWANRLTILPALVGLVGSMLWVIQKPIRHPEAFEDSQVERWLLVILPLLVAAFGFYAVWPRLLDALWLRSY